MLRVAICDDERCLQGQLETFLEDLGKKQNLKLELEMFEDGAEIVENIVKGQRFDIIFIDIVMKNVDGIEAAVQIRKLDKAVQFIYVTFHENYIKDVIKVAPVGFLCKPLQQMEVEESFLNALGYVNAKDEYYRFCYKNVTRIVALKDIVYFQSNLRLVEITCGHGKYIKYGKISEVETELAAYKTQFVRIDRSCLVNLMYISECTHKKIKLINGEVLNVSRNYREKIAELCIPLRGKM